MATIDNHPRKAAAGALALGAALAVPMIGVFEGERHQAYIPVPGDHATLCFGETAGVKLGDTATHAECVNLLSADVRRRTADMQKCLKVQIAEKTAAAQISLAYNIGTKRWCDSVAPLFNAGRPAAACAQGARYVYSGGRLYQGLVRRRAIERKLCEEGLS